MATFQIAVAGEACVVHTEKRSEGVWVAYGYYGDHYEETQSRSEAGALQNWQWIIERIADHRAL